MNALGRRTTDNLLSVRSTRNHCFKTLRPLLGRAADQAAAVTALGLFRLHMAVPADERGEEARRFLKLSALLQSLTATATAETVTDNLEVLAGTTVVAPTAEDVLDELSGYQTSDPRQVFDRVLEGVLPSFETEWLDMQRVRLRGPTSNAMAVAAEALKYATDITHVAIGVTATTGRWAVLGKVPGKVIVLEGGEAKATTYRTYDVSGLLNPVIVLTEKDQAPKRRLSQPPWIVPGDVDREVLDTLGLGGGSM